MKYEDIWVVAAVAGSPDVAALLIEHGADLNKRDRDGKTALMIAVINNHQELCKTLITAKCDLFVQNEVGEYLSQQTCTYYVRVLVEMYRAKGFH